MSDADKVFSGSIPGLYETYLVPLIFETYADDIKNRLASRRPTRVLETAAGTGVVTRALAGIMGKNGSIIATDLNQAMLDTAATLQTDHQVEWKQADAMALPYEDATFDAVVCQFGVMFFPDKVRAYAEAHRVLKPGGVFIFNVWDRISENDFADTITTALEAMFPADPPKFLARTPYGYYDQDIIRHELNGGGFGKPVQITTVTARSHAPSGQEPAIAYCQGTPLRNEIELRGAARLGEATDAAAAAIEKRFGPGPIDGKIQGLVVTAEK